MSSAVNSPQWTLSKTFGQNLGTVYTLASKGTLVYAGNDNTLSSWDVTTGQQVDSLDLQSQVRSIKILGESLFALITETGQVTQFSLSPLAQTGACGSSITDYALEGDSIYTLSSQSTIVVYDLKTMEEKALLNTGIDGIMAIACTAGILALNANDGKKTSLSFCNPETGAVRKTVETPSTITSISTTNRGGFLTFNNSPVYIDGSFQLWDSTDFTMQTTLVVSPGQPINALFVASEGIFVLNGQINQLDNNVTLSNVEEFPSYDNPSSIALMDPTTLVSGSYNSDGIVLWKKAAPEKAPKPALQWTMAQEVSAPSYVSAFARLESGIYTASGNQISKWTLTGNQLTLSSSNTLENPLQALLVSSGKLYAATSTQLISIDPETLQPGASFTSQYVINCATASDSMVYLGCAQGMIYYVNPTTFEALEVGTNQNGISFISVTPTALLITADGNLTSFNPETGKQIATEATGATIPLILPVGDSTIVTAETLPLPTHPQGFKVFAIKEDSLKAQTIKSIDPVNGILVFNDIVLASASGRSQFACYSNDVDLKHLGNIPDSSAPGTLFKLSEDLFLASTASSIQVWQRKNPVNEPTAQKGWCTIS